MPSRWEKERHNPNGNAMTNIDFANRFLLLIDAICRPFDRPDSGFYEIQKKIHVKKRPTPETRLSSAIPKSRVANAFTCIYSPLRFMNRATKVSPISLIS